MIGKERNRGPQKDKRRSIEGQEMKNEEALFKYRE